MDAPAPVLNDAGCGFRTETDRT
ncbi:unnamed protein product, partial [Rotaria sp. Silwood2]